MDALNRAMGRPSPESNKKRGRGRSSSARGRKVNFDLADAAAEEEEEEDAWAKPEVAEKRPASPAADANMHTGAVEGQVAGS
jgi:hypothetical protein